MDSEVASEFEKAALSQPGRGLLAEYWLFLYQHKKWWMIPIVVTLILLGTLLILSSSAAAPFIYTLF
jgi:hypothetical protein